MGVDSGVGTGNMALVWPSLQKTGKRKTKKNTDIERVMFSIGHKISTNTSRIGDERR